MFQKIFFIPFQSNQSVQRTKVPGNLLKNPKKMEPYNEKLTNPRKLPLIFKIINGINLILGLNSFTSKQSKSRTIIFLRNAYTMFMITITLFISCSNLKKIWKMSTSADHLFLWLLASVGGIFETMTTIILWINSLFISGKYSKINSNNVRIKKLLKIE